MTASLPPPWQSLQSSRPPWSGQLGDECVYGAGSHAVVWWQVLHSSAVLKWPEGVPVAWEPSWQPRQPLVTPVWSNLAPAQEAVE